MTPRLPPTKCTEKLAHGPQGRTSNVAKTLRIVAWNLALATLALAALALAGEAWLRLTKPFMFNSAQKEFVAGVGPMFVPGSEVRLTDGQFFWTVSQVNAWGFVDRLPRLQPPSQPLTLPVPAESGNEEEGCHVTLIGDSFVVARQVPVANKLHVRLEDELATALPHLRVTTSAFGLPSTGQINQLPLYDIYARRLSPDVLVLVFVGNDFADNSPTLKALSARGPAGADPRRQPWLTAAREAHGGFVLRPPHPDYALPSGDAFRAETATLLGEHLEWLPAGVRKPLLRTIRRSWFVKWLRVRLRQKAEQERSETLDLVRARSDLNSWPDYERLFEARPITEADLLGRAFAKEPLAPVYQEALALTGFGLDRFQARANRDGAKLLILASHDAKRYGERVFARLAALAAARNIPVIDQSDYIARQGAPLAAAHWPTDAHWNAAGHRWAAQALAEHFAQDETICAAGARPHG